MLSFFARGVVLGAVCIIGASCNSRPADTPGTGGNGSGGGAPTETGGTSGGDSGGASTGGSGGAPTGGSGGTTSGSGGADASGGIGPGGDGGAGGSTDGSGGSTGVPDCEGTVRTGDEPCNDAEDCINDIGEFCGCNPYDRWTCGNI